MAAPFWDVPRSSTTTRNVTGLPDRSSYGFDGLSFEVAYKLLNRSESNPFAVTLSVEPRYGRIDSTTGLGSTNYGAAFKVFTDAVVVKDQLYWAANIEAATQRARDPFGIAGFVPGSSLLLSTALTYKINPAFFIGAELRYFTNFDSGGFHHPVSRALYLGPTFAWRITEKVILNAVIHAQIWGRAAANPVGSLNLDDFERYQSRLKLTFNF